MFFLRGLKNYRKVPSGLIVFFNDTSIPSGWTRFSAADDKMIIGAGSTYAVTSSGGNNTPHTFNSALSSAGGHDALGGTFETTMVSTNSCYGSDNTPVTAGAHTHTAGATTYNPSKRTALLIKADSDYSVLPAKTMIASSISQVHRGLANVTDYSGKYIESKTSIGDIAEVKTVALSSGGSHNHGGSSVCFGGDVDNNRVYRFTAGAHTGTITLDGVTDNLKKVLLSLWTNASANFGPYEKMIGMWESATPPGGWAICNGDNGTPDLRDCFIMPANSGSENTTASGDNTVDLLVPDDTNVTHTGSHDHSGSTRTAAGYLAWHKSTNWSHTHVHSMTDQADISWLPPYYALTFIMKR